MRRRLIELLEESLERHHESEDDALVLKSVIEDDRIQEILREIMETHGPEELDQFERDDGADNPELKKLIERLKKRQSEILSDL